MTKNVEDALEGNDEDADADVETSEFSGDLDRLAPPEEGTSIKDGDNNADVAAEECLGGKGNDLSAGK
jgi:hypothetical protein